MSALEGVACVLGWTLSIVLRVVDIAQSLVGPLGITIASWEREVAAIKAAAEQHVRAQSSADSDTSRDLPSLPAWVENVIFQIQTVGQSHATPASKRMMLFARLRQNCLERMEIERQLASNPDIAKVRTKKTRLAW